METTIFAGLLLTGSLLATEPNPQGREAARYASLATYRQSGLDKLVEPRLQYIERNYLPEFLKTYGVGVTFIYRAAIDHRVEHSWSF